MMTRLHICSAWHYYVWLTAVDILSPCMSLISALRASVIIWCCLTVRIPLKSGASTNTSYMEPHPPDTSTTAMSVAEGKRSRSSEIRRASAPPPTPSDSEQKRLLRIILGAAAAKCSSMRRTRGCLRGSGCRARRRARCGSSSRWQKRDILQQQGKKQLL
jgi:hypothetical protein